MGQIRTGIAICIRFRPEIMAKAIQDEKSILVSLLLFRIIRFDDNELKIFRQYPHQAQEDRGSEGFGALLPVGRVRQARHASRACRTHARR